jgi:hypothetical protein
MASAGGSVPIILDLTGGRNGGDSPLVVPQNQCVEAVNVDWVIGQVANRRHGATALALAGGTAPTGPFNYLTRYQPGVNEGAAELWSVDSAATPLVKRLAGGTSWADVPMTDPITGEAQHIQTATLNGKLYIAYKSAVDRLHVYDPNMTTPIIRRVGIDPGTAAPTVANTGIGTYAATPRFYRVRFALIDTIFGAPVRVSLSEPTPSVAFTPSGSGTSARVTRPTVPTGESVSHWILEGSTDNVLFYELNATLLAISGTVIATTTYDDAALPSTYSSMPLSDLLGTYTLWTAVRYLRSDGNRLLGAGAYMPAGNTSRVWWSPVLGSGTADDERIPITAQTQTTNGLRNYDDVGERNGGGITGIGGPISGSRIYIFKYREIHLATPTGDPVVPYLFRKLTGGGPNGAGGIGNIDASMIVESFDDAGNAAVYFWSETGPYRLGAGGLERIYWDIRDIVSTVNLSATVKVGHGLFYTNFMQVWWWLSVASDNEPTIKVVFDVRKGRTVSAGEVRQGWAQHNGLSCQCRTATLFANTVAASMSRDLKPYVGRSGATARILKCDASLTTLDDDGTPYQGYVTTRPLVATNRSGRQYGMDSPVVVATAAPGVLLQVSSVTNFGYASRSARIDLTPSGHGETRVVRKVEGLEDASFDTAQLTIGDEVPSLQADWTIDQITIPLLDHGAK